MKYLEGMAGIISYISFVIWIISLVCWMFVTDHQLKELKDRIKILEQDKRA